LEGSWPVDTRYHTNGVKSQLTETTTPRYRGVSHTKPIDEAKRLVSVLDLAHRLCGPRDLRRVGERWAARCPLPDHEDKTPSFCVYPETESFFCFGCLKGGDVVDLYRFSKGYDEREAGTAAAMLLMDFGFAAPQRPPAWFRKQERQRAARDAVEETKKNVFRRRLFKYTILPYVDAIQGDEEREKELRRAWADFKRLLP
jgi:hypothetical protein